MSNLINETTKASTSNMVIDLGKNELKGFSFKNNGEILKVVNFDSVMKKTITPHVFTQNSNPNKYKIEFEGELYEVGDGIEKGSLCNENSKLTKHHQLCLFLAVSLLMETDSEFVNLIVGLPSSHIANLEERKLFEQTLMCEQGKEITIKVNNAEKRFVISNVIAESEGMAILPRLKLMMNENTKSIAVIDIGGHNFNLRLFDAYGYAIEEKGISEEQVGINNLLNNLRKELLTNLKQRDRNITLEDLKRFVKNRDLDDDMEIANYNKTKKEFMNEFVKNYIQEYIIDRLSSHGIKLSAKGMKYLFTGGGSNLLKPYIEEILESNIDSIYFSETSKWDNCLSFLINNLFKVNLNKANIFSTIVQQANEKLSNDDKSKQSNSALINELKAIFC